MGVRTGDFSLSVRFPQQMLEGLPKWFNELDRDSDGQISLDEWVRGRREPGEFRRYDLNDDGLITADELLHLLNRPVDLKFRDNRVNYHGIAAKSTEEYRGKKSFKILSMKVTEGKTYQIDLISPAFQAFLFLEDADGNLLQQNSSPNIGGNSRIVFRANKTETCRLVATSLGGYKTGDFSLSGSIPARCAGGFAGMVQ